MAQYAVLTVTVNADDMSRPMLGGKPLLRPGVAISACPTGRLQEEGLVVGRHGGL
jgi:hypothetical protein